jgi:hypothetical protein
MALMNIDEEQEWSIHGDSKQGISVRQGSNIIILPPDVVAKIRESK